MDEHQRDTTVLRAKNIDFGIVRRAAEPSAMNQQHAESLQRPVRRGPLTDMHVAIAIRGAEGYRDVV